VYDAKALVRLERRTLRLSSATTESNEKITSSAVTGWPSCHLAFGLRWKI